jgi:myo-inositol 2-dehydrogenase / D-chiro-inositol 1-dehydrogenase
MNGKKLHFGVIGAGRIGRVHTKSLAFQIPEAEIVSVFDVNCEAAEALAADFGIPQVAGSVEEIFGDKGIEAVAVCSSTDTHADLIIRAAEAGKHIFCEKPISYTLKQIDDALAAVAKAGVKLQIGFNRRFDTNYARVRKAVADGEVGKPCLVHITSRDPLPPPIRFVKLSGGMFLDMMIHDFDMARFLTGDEVEEVYAAAGVMADPAIGEVGDVDTAVVTLRFKSGAIGTIDNSRKAVFGYDQRVEILGTEGKVASENRFPNQVVMSTGKAIYSDLPLNFFMDRYTDSFAEEVRQFTRAVLEGKPVPVTGADSRVPVIMAMAARKSFDEHRPVKLTEVEA